MGHRASRGALDISTSGENKAARQQKDTRNKDVEEYDEMTFRELMD
jgi:hypothetical protein